MLKQFSLACFYTILGFSTLLAQKSEEYNSKSKVLIPAQILVKGIKGKVSTTRFDWNNPKDTGTTTDLKSGDKVQQGVTVKTGNNSKANLIFSNGAVIALEQNTTVRVSQFLQAGGFDFADTSIDKTTIVNGKVPKIGEMGKEPSHSITALVLEQGTMYARVKKLHKRSKYKVESPLGVLKVLGTAWKQTVTVEPEKLQKTVNIFLQEGLLEFKPINSNGVASKAIIIRPEQHFEITGTFESLTAMQAIVNTQFTTNIDIALSSVITPILEQGFDTNFQEALPEFNEEQIIQLVETPNANNSEYSGDQGVTQNSAFGSSGSGAGAQQQSSPIPTPFPAPTPAS